MNLSFLTHGCWLAIACAAFFAGSLGFPLGTPASTKNAPATRDRALSPFLDSQLSRQRSTQTARTALAHRLSPTGKITLSTKDIAALGQQFRQATSPIDRRLAFSRLLEGLTAENALEIREQIDHLEGNRPEFREFHYAWGAVAGEEAALFGADTEKDDMSPALAGWANADPTAALAWFKGLDMENDPAFDPLLKDRKLSESHMRQHLMRGLVHGLANADPDLASKLIHETDIPMNKAGLMHTVVEAVLRKESAEQAATWAEGLPDGKLRIEAMERVADQFGRKAPKEAASWAAQLGDPSEYAGIIARVGSQWATKDPEAAVSWLSELPAGRGQETGMARALGAWTHSDPKAASEYLATLPPSESKDAAISGFSRRLAWEDPASAIAWAETIRSQGTRQKTLVDAGRAWLRKDASAAKEWVSTAGVSEEVRRALLKPPKERDRR